MTETSRSEERGRTETSRSEERGRTETSRSEERGRTGQAAETALDFAVGGTALAADKVAEAVERAVERGEEAVRQGVREARDKTAEAVHAARKVVEDDSDGRAYEERTRDELYALAAERRIEGRSSMRKAELIDALRANR